MNGTNITTPFDQIAESLFSFHFNPWSLLKAVFMIALLFYLAFAVIVVRQVSLMIKTINGHFKIPVKFIAWVHLLVAIGVIVFAWIIL